MPASLFPDMERSNSGLEDQRALQLALELSMLGLSNENESSFGTSYDSEGRSKKSQNTTECVPVPSSEHVAEIVGRQDVFLGWKYLVDYSAWSESSSQVTDRVSGCKIKALRAKTNTYIKTPVRGEEPVFVVTGRREDVNAAKREILSAAEHFSQIRAQRKNNMNGSLTPGPNSNIPGQTTIQVRVPYRVVGLVVGPKGATIKRIQQQTNTYIVTPSRDKEPVFEVTGLPDNVESARKEIEAHIAMRTGGLVDSPEENDFHSNGVDQAYSTNVATTNYVNSLYKADFGTFPRDSNNLLPTSSSSTSRPQDVFTFPPTPSSETSPKLTNLYSSAPGFTGAFGSGGFGLYDVDEGLGESPTFEQPMFPQPPPAQGTTVWSDFGTTTSSTVATLFGGTTSSTASTALPRRSNSLGSADSGISDPLLLDHPPARRIRSDPLTVTGLSSSFTPLTTGSAVGLISCFTTTSSGSSSSISSSPTDSLGSLRKAKRDCVVCFESEVVAALVPCGHNMFCLECANRICEKREPECPICRKPANQAIRIYS